MAGRLERTRLVEGKKASLGGAYSIVEHSMKRSPIDSGFNFGFSSLNSSELTNYQLNAVDEWKVFQLFEKLPLPQKTSHRAHSEVEAGRRQRRLRKQQFYYVNSFVLSLRKAMSTLIMLKASQWREWSICVGHESEWATLKTLLAFRTRTGKVCLRYKALSLVARDLDWEAWEAESMIKQFSSENRSKNIVWGILSAPRLGTFFRWTGGKRVPRQKFEQSAAASVHAKRVDGGMKGPQLNLFINDRENFSHLVGGGGGGKSSANKKRTKAKDDKVSAERTIETLFTRAV
jgi:hypothetical protein